MLNLSKDKEPDKDYTASKIDPAANKLEIPKLQQSSMKDLHSQASFKEETQHHSYQ